VPNSLIQSYFPNNNGVKPVEGSYTPEELVAQNQATNPENKDQQRLSLVTQSYSIKPKQSAPKTGLASP
jgi:hypothetical protein